MRLHIGLSIATYGLLSISMLYAWFVFFQDYQLRHKRAGWIIRHLPPLIVVETQLFQMIALGLMLLILSLVSGFMLEAEVFSEPLRYKLFFAIVTLSILATLLFGHWQYGWRGKTARGWFYLGFIGLMMLAYCSFS